MRGGSCSDSGTYIRSASRRGTTLSTRNSLIGFRLSITLPIPTPPSTAPSGSKPSLLVAPFTQKQADAKRTEWAKHLSKKVVETNSIGMKLSLIPAGEYHRGATEEEILQMKKGNRYFKEKQIEDELPQHKVHITKPFYLATTEVTQKQWRLVMGTTPWKTKTQWRTHGSEKIHVTADDNHPATYVNGKDIQEFIKRLNQNEGVTYRLPTEAEWEYACRAGTTTPFYFGSRSNGNNSSINGYSPFGTPAKGKNQKTTCYVRSYRANSFGLYGMHGNVCEWCSDRYDKDYYKQFANKIAIDPQGPQGEPTATVLRGGSWSSSAHYTRSAVRSGGQGAGRDSNSIGFRLSRTP